MDGERAVRTSEGPPAGGAWRVAALYAALTLVLAYPLTLHPASTTLPGDPDTNLFMWTLAWDAHAAAHQPLSLFDANIYHPQRLTLAYSENLLGSAALAAPVLWLTGNPVLALNTVMLLSVVLCGLGAYVLARRAGIQAPGAIVCGLVFAFSPARFFRIGQLHLTTVQWIPFTLAYLHAYLDGGRRRDLRLAVAFFTLQALTSGHGTAFLVLALLVVLACRAFRREPLALGRRFRDFGLAGAMLLLPVVLIALPYRTVQVEMGLRRSLVNWEAAPQSFLASPSIVHSFLLGLAPEARINETASAFLFPGYLPILLAGIALVWRRASAEAGRSQRPRGVAGAYGLMTLAAVLLSAGPPIGLWPLVYWLPGLNFVRVPSRFMILAVLGLAVLAGLGVDRLAARLGPARRRVLAVAIGALLVAEFATIPLPVVPYRVEIPAVDRWLAGRPKPFVVAEVPVTTSERLQSTYMLHSMAHWQKTVHGHSGIRPPLHEELYSQLRSFPDEPGLRALARLGVGYVVVHTDFYRPGEWAEIERRLAAFESWLTLEHSEGAGRVYSLHLPPDHAR